MIVGSYLVHGRYMYSFNGETLFVMLVLGVMFDDTLHYTFGRLLLF
jgi:membrane protein DedA with SNARE-associated domain